MWISKIVRSKSRKFDCHIALTINEYNRKNKIDKPGQPMYQDLNKDKLSWDMQVQHKFLEVLTTTIWSLQTRGLTVRERWIQSFPDDFVVKGGTVQGRVQTGNAVPPLLAGGAKAIKVLKWIIEYGIVQNLLQIMW